MKTQQIFVTVLVLSICQWSVLGISVDGKLKDDPSEKSVDLLTTVAPPTAENTTIPTTTSTSTSTSTTTTTTTTTTTPPPTTTTTTTTPPPPTTTTPSHNITTAAPATTTPPPTPSPCPGHFNGPSFIGGMVLTIGMIAIGFVAHKIYKSKFDRNYHTL